MTQLDKRAKDLIIEISSFLRRTPSPHHPPHLLRVILYLRNQKKTPYRRENSFETRFHTVTTTKEYHL